MEWYFEARRSSGRSISVDISNILENIQDHYPIDAQQWVTDDRSLLDFSPSHPRVKPLTPAHLLPINPSSTPAPQFLSWDASAGSYMLRSFTPFTVIAPSTPDHHPIFFLPTPANLVFSGEWDALDVPVVVWPCTPTPESLAFLSDGERLGELWTSYGLRCDSWQADPTQICGTKECLSSGRRLVNRHLAVQDFWADLAFRLVCSVDSQGKTMVEAVVGVMGSGKTSFLQRSVMAFFATSEERGEESVSLFQTAKNSLLAHLQSLSAEWTAEDAESLFCCLLYLPLSGRIYTHLQSTSPHSLILSAAEGMGQQSRLPQIKEKLRNNQVLSAMAAMLTGFDAVCPHPPMLDSPIGRRILNRFGSLDGSISETTETRALEMLQQLRSKAFTASIARRNLSGLPFLPVCLNIDEIARARPDLLSTVLQICSGGACVSGVAGVESVKVLRLLFDSRLIGRHYRLNSLFGHTREVLEGAPELAGVEYDPVIALGELGKTAANPRVMVSRIQQFKVKMKRCMLAGASVEDDEQRYMWIESPGISYQQYPIHDARLSEATLCGLPVRESDLFLGKAVEDIERDHYMCVPFYQPIPRCARPSAYSATREITIVCEPFTDTSLKRHVDQLRSILSPDTSGVVGSPKDVTDAIRRTMGPMTEDVGIKIFETRLRLITSKSPLIEQVHGRMKILPRLFGPCPLALGIGFERCAPGHLWMNVGAKLTADLSVCELSDQVRDVLQTARVRKLEYVYASAASIQKELESLRKKVISDPAKIRAKTARIQLLEKGPLPREFFLDPSNHGVWVNADGAAGPDGIISLPGLLIALDFKFSDITKAVFEEQHTIMAACMPCPDLAVSVRLVNASNALNDAVRSWRRGVAGHIRFPHVVLGKHCLGPIISDILREAQSNGPLRDK